MNNTEVLFTTVMAETVSYSCTLSRWKTIVERNLNKYTVKHHHLKLWLSDYVYLIMLFFFV